MTPKNSGLAETLYADESGTTLTSILGEINE